MKPITSLRGIYRPLGNGGEPHYGLTHIVNALQTYPIATRPIFQRLLVWSRMQQADFVGHLLEGGETLPCVLNTGPDGELVPAELVDGQQRVVACTEWTTGKIAARLADGREVWLRDLDQPSERRCGNIIGLRFRIVRLTYVECIELYLRLNRGGTPHTDHEIDRVRELLADATEHANPKED